MFKFARKILSFGMKSFYEQKSLTKKFHMISKLLSTYCSQKERMYTMFHTLQLKL